MQKMKQRMDEERAEELRLLNLRLKQQQILAMNDSIKPALKSVHATALNTPKGLPLIDNAGR